MKTKPVNEVNTTTHNFVSFGVRNARLRILLGVCITVFLLMAFKPTTAITIYTIGDSTMCLYDTTNNNPQRGWCQMLPQFFNSNATIVNAAAGGRSSKSFYNEPGKWNTVINNVKAGDYVFIQFSHNDEKDPALYPDFHTDPGSTYDAYLTAYVNETRAKGGIPVLFTPICRWYFDSNGLITASGQHNVAAYGDYPGAMRNVATALNVPLIDLTASTKTLYEAYGISASSQLHITTDNTHPNLLGATLIAQLASQEMKSKGILTDYMNSSTDIILSPTSLSFGDLTINLTSSESSFSISGFNLSPSSGNVTVTAPANFEVSATSGAGFGSSINVAYTNGTLATSTVYARFKPTTVQVYNATITAAIGGTTLQSVAVTGQGTPVPTGLTAASATWSLSSSQAATSVSGSLSAQSQNTVGLAGIVYNSTLGTVTGWQRVGSTGFLPYTTYSTSSYVEYTVAPQAGYYFILNSASLNALGGGTSSARLAVYYSLDGFSTSTALGTASYYASASPTSYAATFATPITLLNTSSASATVQGSTSFSPNITVKGGQTLTVRMYPWAGSTGRYLANKLVVLSGNTATASVPAAPTTSSVFPIYATSATGGGSEISADNNALITAKGVCWNLSGSPTTGDPKTNDGSGTNAFISAITGLVPGLTYYVRAYATNSAGTSYGNEVTFTTSSTATEPLLTTGAVTNVGATSASVSGNISSDGGAALTSSGFCWSSTNATPTTADSKNNVGVNTGAITSTLSGLTSSTLYYIRSYAVNNSGLTGYGAVVSFTTAGDFYNVAGADISVPTGWGTNSDGSGANPDFSKDNQIYHFTNASSGFSQNWAVSVNSKVVVGNGTDAISLTIPSGFYLSGKVDLSNNSTLNVQNSANLVLGNIHTSSVVNYDGSNSLTVLAGAYGNIASTNDAGAARVFASGAISISGTFTKGSAVYTAPTAGIVTFNGSSAQSIPGVPYYNLQLNNASGASVTDSLVMVSGGTLTVTTGTLSVFGVIDNKSANAPVITGTLLIKSGGHYRVNGGSFPAATYEANSTVFVITGGPALVSTIGGNLVWNSTGSAGFSVTPVTIGGDFTMTAGTWAHGNGGVARTVIVQGDMYLTGGTYTIANTSTVNSTVQTLTVNGNLNVSGGLLYASNNGLTGSNGTINVGKNLIHTGGTIGNGSSVTNVLTGRIVFNGTAPQTIQTTGFTNNLNIVINNAAGVSLASDLTVDAALSLTSGVLTTGEHNLIMNSAATIAETPSATAMVYVNGTGQFRRLFTTAGSFTFPIGDVASVSEFAPVTINVSADAYSSAYVAVQTTRTKHPNNGSASDYINRYWTLTSSGFSNPTYSGTFTYAAADVNGNESIVFGAHYSNSIWENVGTVSVATHSFSTPSFTRLGDFTCADASVVPAVPVITTSATGLSFGRVNRNSTSTEQTYSITGYYLSPASGDVTITAPANFQISLVSGSGFTSVLTMPYTDGNLSPQTVYVHFVAPNVSQAELYGGSLTNAGGGASTQNITLSGTSIISNADLGVNLVVAKDGSGDYTTLQAAINAIPASHSESPFIVYMRPGFYHEKVTIPATLSDISIMGEHRDSTILDYTDYVGMSGTTNVPGTNAVQTLQVNASNISFQNMTIQDTVSIERAVAVNVGNSADRVVFRNCNIYGHQDTYYLWGCYRVYHSHCKITGSVDYIFGSGMAVFDSCDLVINRNGGVLTAASTPANFKYGLVFRNCTISTDPIGFDGTPVSNFYLGRPWNDNPKTVFLNCYEPATLAAAGYTLMNADPAASVNQNTLYAEYGCYGPGSAYTSRATISGNSNYGRQLTAEESANYTLSTIFAAASKTDSPFPSGDWFPGAANDALPVELTSFSAFANQRKVNLTWKTSTEANTFGFTIERKAERETSWSPVGFVRGAGNSNSPRNYSFCDNAPVTGKILYRLKMADNDGTFKHSEEITAIVALPATFNLAQNYPNPFNPSTKIEYTLPTAARVQIEVYSIIGQRVAVLVDAQQDAGYYTTQFSMSGGVASGIYIYRLRAYAKQDGKEYSIIKKMILEK